MALEKITISPEEILAASQDIIWGEVANHDKETVAEAFRTWLVDHIEGVLLEADWWTYHHSKKVLVEALPPVEPEKSTSAA